MVFAPPYGRPTAVAASLNGGHPRLKRQQILRRNDPEMLKTGLCMLASKTGNQASVLKYFARYRKKDPSSTIYGELLKAATEIRGLAELIQELDPQASGIRDVAMGYEGRAAATYWTAL